MQGVLLLIKAFCFVTASVLFSLRLCKAKIVSIFGVFLGFTSDVHALKTFAETKSKSPSLFASIENVFGTAGSAISENATVESLPL